MGIPPAPTGWLIVTDRPSGRLDRSPIQNPMEPRRLLLRLPRPKEGQEASSLEEMLLPIAGRKEPAKREAKPAAQPGSLRKIWLANDSQPRDWAMKVMAKHSGVEFSIADQNALKNHTMTAPEVPLANKPMRLRRCQEARRLAQADAEGAHPRPRRKAYSEARQANVTRASPMEQRTPAERRRDHARLMDAVATFSP